MMEMRGIRQNGWCRSSTSTINAAATAAAAAAGSLGNCDGRSFGIAKGKVVEEEEEKEEEEEEEEAKELSSSPNVHGPHSEEEE